MSARTVALKDISIHQHDVARTMDHPYGSGSISDVVGYHFVSVTAMQGLRREMTRLNRELGV